MSKNSKKNDNKIDNIRQFPGNGMEFEPEKPKRHFRISVGIILVLIFIVYMGFHVFSSITKKDVKAYEVTLGTIVDKNFFQGLILRTEEIIPVQQSGNIYYYQTNKSRVGVKSLIYSIDINGNVIGSHLSGNENYRMLGADDLTEVIPAIDSFVGNFNPVNFHSTYSFKNDVEDYLQQLRVADIALEHAPEIAAAKENGTFFDTYAHSPGFLVYNVDGYEGKELSQITASDFGQGSYSPLNLRSVRQVETGMPAYKLVTEEDWQIVIPLEKSKKLELMEYPTLKVRFTQDNSVTWATTEFIESGDTSFLVLSFDDSMERYADQRFVNVELLLDETKGLKIPNSAILEKEFFVVPKEFFYDGRNSQNPSLLVKSEKGKDNFVTPTIYFETEDAYYIDNEYVTETDVLLMENSQKTHIAGQEKDILKGVYNINKGFTAFKRVDILFQNDDYAIVRNQASYSIALYDYIVLVADSVKENEIL